jgi:hypothetical protein
MTQASHGKTQSEQTPDRVCTPTVASLGVQVRLVPVDVNRESKLARLIASGETMRLEWESLFQQVLDLLSDDVRGVQDSDRSSRPSDL